MNETKPHEDVSATATSMSSSKQVAEDINIISHFLADANINGLDHPIKLITKQDAQPLSRKEISPSTIILVGSAILHTVSTLFDFLQRTCPVESSISTIIITGGIGHSTTHLYDAVRCHPRYHDLFDRIARNRSDNLNVDSDRVTELQGLMEQGLCEAEIFYAIFIHYFSGANVMKSWNRSAGLTVLIEHQSRNCGANALESRRTLEKNDIFLGQTRTGRGTAIADDVLIIQDPTMCLRTKASFEKVYRDEVCNHTVRFWSWPTFVPSVREKLHVESSVEISAERGLDAAINWDVQAQGMDRVDTCGLWNWRRFFGLILGEIPRLRDDHDGYGPRGKGFIDHVDIPERVDLAWSRLQNVLGHER